MTRKKGRPRGLLVDGERLRRLREAAGLTGEELATAAGINLRTISRAERGEHRLSPDSLRRLADALRVEPQALALARHDEVTGRLEALHLAPLAPPDPWVPRPEHAEYVTARITASPARPCCIAGPSGIGKTALARFLARKLAPAFPHGVVWVTASRESRPVDVREVQLRVADALDFRPRLPAPGQLDPQTWSRAFAAEFLALPRLLIVDDLLSVGFLQRLVPGDGPAPVLVTTHLRHVAERFGGDALVLDGISVDAARDILVHHLGAERVQADPDGLAAVHQALAGVPRSLHIAGTILERERLTGLGDYAARIRSSPAAGEFPTAMRDATNSLRVSFQQIEDHVSPPAWRLLAALSVFDEVSFSLPWARVAGGLESVDEAASAVGELLDVYLVAEARAPGEVDCARDAAAAERRFRLDSHVPLFAYLRRFGSAVSRANSSPASSVPSCSTPK